MKKSYYKALFSTVSYIGAKLSVKNYATGANYYSSLAEGHPGRTFVMIGISYNKNFQVYSIIVPQHLLPMNLEMVLPVRCIQLHTTKCIID